MEDDNRIEKDSETIDIMTALQQMWNHALVYFIPLLYLALYLLFPRKLFAGIDLSVVVLIVAAVIAVPYIKGRARWSILCAMVALSVIFPQNTEIKLILAFLSIVTIVLVEYVSRQGIRRLFLAVVFVASLILVLAWVFSLFLTDPAVDPPGVSFFGSKVGFVNILIFALMSLVYLLLGGKKGRGWVLVYLLAHLFLFTLFSTLSKQVYVSIVLFCGIAIPTLVILRRHLTILHILCSIVAVYFLFSLVGPVNLLHSRVEALGSIGSSDYSSTRDSLKELDLLDPAARSANLKGVPECYKSEYYLGCLHYSALCTEDYVRPYLDQADSIEEVMETFVSENDRLANYLGTPAALKKWLVICGRKITIFDKSDRLALVMNGLEELKGATLFGSESLSSLHHINYYSEVLENYPHYHNFIVDLGLEAGFVILAFLLIAILFSMLLAVRGSIESNLLGAMIAAFVGLRLVSGSHYELFYLLLLVALVLYRECAEQSK